MISTMYRRSRASGRCRQETMNSSLPANSGRKRYKLAAISYVDSLIGRLIEALDRNGLASSTAIVLWGDNGFHLGEKLHWRKLVLWEEATRVPLIIVPPSTSQIARRVYEPTSLIDIFPTIAELAGSVDVPPNDGTSLAPSFKDSGWRRVQS